ncbi:ABC transporter ATP-binding protein (plasmid) [Agrobacterium tumefaciens]|uniref:ABC transporter ATP-binding protein n=1 Tax=Agrobacterium tumefaciens TaxID=358 RepID=A0AAP9E9Y3_AGRTU|nr:ABC transporter ATP-binding protein [Agrobacterium tumefaciens]QDY97730.1 ABC transporter ATP-binding protein [Agrobacterium tumefaciens]UXS12853.1 ABC transporter ATP-binding protein [Agrobacterium tumefaciens]UXS20215.1 ABC transporter ATP-binding protein [Agrobacterium tumefaciens]UXS27861.1 ABC transporter ATP-binding protein [Agrobacterium tumefaciens]
MLSGNSWRNDLDRHIDFPGAETDRGILLDIDRLSFWYGDAGQKAPTLDAVSLKVLKGEVVALVGESGSGKSTLINCVIGLHAGHDTRVEAEALRFQQTDLRDLSEREWRRLRGRHIAYVSQDPTGSLNPLTTVGDQLQEALRFFHPNLGRAEAKREALELMRKVGFAEPQNIYGRYPHQLSGGMNQRISIAAALCGEPELLLADEPTSALDVSVQKQVLDHLEKLVVETGTAMLFITHDLAVAADRAERIVVLQHGHVREEGPVETVLASPRHGYTRQLLAAAPFLQDIGEPEKDVGNQAPEKTDSATGENRLLNIEGLEKHFGDHDGSRFTAVGGINLHVDRQETVCVVGESGSGKTTLARLILKLTAADAGNVHFNGYDVRHLSGAALKQYRREAQMVYQNPFASLDLRYNVREILCEPLRIHGIGSRSERRGEASRMLDLVGLPEKFLERRPGELSGGQRQRVAIARALITSPKLLILDEAVSALDVSVQERILELLRSIQQELGLAYLFITHDLSVVHNFSDRVYVMKRGEVVESGSTASVFDAPQHDYTRLLLASAPGQLARGKVENSAAVEPERPYGPAPIVVAR